MFKKLFFVFYFLFSFFLTYNFTFASEFEKSIINDFDSLNDIIINEKIEVPDSYKLIEVKTFSFNNDFNYNNNDFDLVDGISSIFNSKWKINNIRKVEDDFYFNDKVLSSDWFDGPSDIVEEYKEMVEAKFNVSANINVNILSSELGFSVIKGSDKTKTFVSNVKDNEKLNVKVFGNYQKYNYSVFKNGKYVCDGCAYKPVGLVFKQYRFSK